MSAPPSNIVRKLMTAADELEAIARMIPADAPPQVRAGIDARMKHLREETDKFKAFWERKMREAP